MSPIDAELFTFVAGERNHFSADDNNKFAMAFGQIIRYRSFLIIINERYESCNARFSELMEMQKTLFAPPGGSVNIEQAAWLDENAELNKRIQLEIETYYLFAKILLDRIAHFLEYFFGPERRLSFDSHDQMTKCFRTYCEAKELMDFEKMENRLTSLKTDIADFRDYQIAHEKSPRTMRGISFTGSGNTSIISTKLYPKETDEQVQSKKLGKLEEDLLLYLKEVMSLIQANRNKTKLKLKGVA